MRLLLFLTILIGLASPAGATSLDDPDSMSSDAGLRWIKEYRTKPDPQSVPRLYKTLSERGTFISPESSGVYTGFLAGVIGSNPRTAKSLITKMLPMTFEDQWILIRAVAYSGHPRWEELMLYLIDEFPDRLLLIEHYLNGTLPTLENVPLEPKRATTMEKVRRIFKRETYVGGGEEKDEPITFATHPELIDIHWGIYFATGESEPIARIVELLPWAKERDDVDKLTAGGMAKFTLAANASRDVETLRLLKGISHDQPKKVRRVLEDVIEAAETADAGRIRKDALAVVSELRLKGPGSKREIALWGKVGQTALSLGCLGAAVTGQVEFGLPCVLGGALSSAALNYLASPEDG
jgi:hypothetical protein